MCLHKKILKDSKMSFALQSDALCPIILLYPTLYSHRAASPPHQSLYEVENLYSHTRTQVLISPVFSISLSATSRNAAKQQEGSSRIVPGTRAREIRKGRE